MLFRYRNEEAKNINAAATKARQQSMFNASIAQRRAEESAADYTDTATTGAVTFVAVPASASATGTAGQISFDGSYLYVCIASSTWMRAAIATW